MDLKEFLGKQGEIYEKFKGNESGVAENGIRLDPALEKEVGAHVIVSKYSLETLLKVKELSRRIAEVVPAVLYNDNNTHVTVMALTKDFFHEPDQAMIKSLIEATAEAMQKIQQAPCPLEFVKPLFNTDCVMLEGIPQNDSLLKIFEEVVNSCSEHQIPVKMPWGCHSTISRFTEHQSPSEVADFLRLMEEVRKEEPFAQTQIESICVGWCTASIKDGFNLFIEKEFPLI